jgi:hypothetical protein
MLFQSTMHSWHSPYCPYKPWTGILAAENRAVNTYDSDINRNYKSRNDQSKY